MSDFSIQAFYRKEVPTSASMTSPIKRQVRDDGFTEAEVEAGNNPLGRPWNPPEPYQEVCIAHIRPGPAKIRFHGRIVNYAPAFLNSKNTYSRPAHQLIIKDNTGVISVKLVPIGIPVSRLLIGQLVTVWASWVGTTANSNHGSIPFVTMYTPINPADVGIKQFIQFIPDNTVNQNLCRVPLEYEHDEQKTKSLPGLMTLGQYLKTGHDTSGVRIIVCIKSIGSRKRILIHNREKETELVEVTIWDDTASCVMTLWEDKANSASLWTPNETILLLTSPKFTAPREFNGIAQPVSAGITLMYSTLVDVDPDFPDANWLRQWVKNRVKTGTVYVPFPNGVWDVEDAIHGPVRALFTLAEVDDFARSDPAMDFTGKLNLTILGMDLLDLYRRKMLCCIECCGVPLYSNHPSATCRNCMKKKFLVLNPRVIGILADETGCIAQGKLVWSEQAWDELFFPTPITTAGGSVNAEASKVEGDMETARLPPSSWVDLTAMGNGELRTLEEQMLYARFTLTFG